LGSSASWVGSSEVSRNCTVFRAPVNFARNRGNGPWRLCVFHWCIKSSGICTNVSAVSVGVRYWSMSLSHQYTQTKLTSTVGSTIALAKSLFAHSIYERRNCLGHEFSSSSPRVFFRGFQSKSK
jgi:hypothetical protein